MPDRDLIAEGRRLLSAATPGRWLVQAAFADGSAEVSTAEFGPVCVIASRDAVGGGAPAAADAELIAYAHNTYGQLLDELEQQTGRRVIETVGELDTLPVRTVVMDSPYPEGEVYQRTSDGLWVEPGFHAMHTTRALALPATLLWRPEANDA